MPERKNLLRQTTYAQGEDSWVEYVPFTFAERFAEVKDKSIRDEVIERVKRWNWVDEKGNELPQPEDEPEIINSVVCRISC